MDACNVEVRPYYPTVVQVQPRYVTLPVYYQQPYVDEAPGYRSNYRHEHWRREHWRREQWRREHWRHARCRHHHWQR